MKPKRLVSALVLLALAILTLLIIRDRSRSRDAIESADHSLLVGPDGQFIPRPPNNMNVSVTLPPTNPPPPTPDQSGDEG